MVDYLLKVYLSDDRFLISVELSPGDPCVLIGFYACGNAVVSAHLKTVLHAVRLRVQNLSWHDDNHSM